MLTVKIRSYTHCWHRWYKNTTVQLHHLAVFTQTKVRSPLEGPSQGIRRSEPVRRFMLTASRMKPNCVDKLPAVIARRRGGRKFLIVEHVVRNVSCISKSASVLHLQKQSTRNTRRLNLEISDFSPQFYVPFS